MGQDRQKGIRWLLGFVTCLLVFTFHFQVSNREGIIAWMPGQALANGLVNPDYNYETEIPDQKAQELFNKLKSAVRKEIRKYKEQLNAIKQYDEAKNKEDLGAVNVAGLAASLSALLDFAIKEYHQSVDKTDEVVKALEKRKNQMSRGQIIEVRKYLKSLPDTPMSRLYYDVARFPRPPPKENAVSNSQKKKTSVNSKSKSSRSAVLNKDRAKKPAGGSSYPGDRDPDGEYEDQYPDDGDPDGGYEDQYPDDGGPDGEYEDQYPDDGGPDGEYEEQYPDDGGPDGEYEDQYPDDGGPDGEYEEQYPDDGGPDGEYEEQYPDDGGPDGEYEEQYPDDGGPDGEYEEQYPEDGGPDGDYEEENPEDGGVESEYDDRNPDEQQAPAN